MTHKGKALELFLSHRGGLVRYAHGILRDSAHAEDVVQDAWLRFSALPKSQTTPGAQAVPEEPVGYLYRIVRNLAIDVTRRLSREERYLVPQADHPVAEAADDSPAPDATAEARDDLRVMRAAMEELPERTRIALEMHRFGEVKLKDIAAHLGISVGLAHALVVDGLEHCRERLCRR
ncbi:sigma-70 family RNA polymerase sigma factor [Novosphingobium terrae]|uniref:sigma-70 family RNA polymerase sigma factor n=1 Tax=Novosphingobium terrae TaxID=2726189 RepID=UPI00197F800A|nr:sigma-70 family RNA polymerase sigma factor [Novosphingobium terrae]